MLSESLAGFFISLLVFPRIFGIHTGLKSTMVDSVYSKRHMMIGNVG